MNDDLKSTWENETSAVRSSMASARRSTESVKSGSGGTTDNSNPSGSWARYR